MIEESERPAAAGLSIDGAESVDAPADDQRWSSIRTVLALGVVGLALVIAMNMLGGFGNSGSTTDEATINNLADDADQPTASATATAEPTTRPSATPDAAPTEAAPRSDSENGAAGAASAEAEPPSAKVLPGWADVTNIYDGGGTLVVQTGRSQFEIVDLATGEWSTMETPPSIGFSPFGRYGYPTATGIVAATAAGAELRPWDGSEPTRFGDEGQTIVAWSDDEIILGGANIYVPGQREASLVAHRISTAESKVVDLPAGPSVLWRWFSSAAYPLVAELGGTTAVWTFDDGWIDVGPGNAIAVSRQGLLAQVCSLNATTVTCNMETVLFDGTRTATHPNAVVHDEYNTSVTTDLHWVAGLESESTDGFPSQPSIILTDLRTGARVDAGKGISAAANIVGSWLGDGHVFALLDPDASLRFVDASTGDVAVITETPWTARSQAGPTTMSTTFLDIPFPQPTEITE